MKILYCRVSTLDQKTDRQRVDEINYDLVIEDFISGSVSFFERPGGREIKILINKGVTFSLHIISIDRLGRNLREVLNTIHFFTERKIPITFISQGLCTLDSSGNEIPIAKMMISILGTVAEMERVQIKERQLEGIKVAKLKGIYKGRVTGTKEDALSFLSKKGNKEALAYLKKGYKAVDVSKITGLHINTLTKIKRIGLT